MFRILILGDGQYDVGSESTLYSATDEKPALACLVHRLLGEPKHVEYKCCVFREYARPHRDADGDFRKTMAAIEIALVEKYNAIVILTDRDGDKKSQRLDNIRRGRDEMGYEYPRSAVGQAVEAFDAWMVVDGNALQAAGATGKQSHTDPETLDGKNDDRDPKVLAMKYLGGSDGLGKKYAAIAAALDIELLDKCCPKGFRPFGKEVKENIAPKLSPDCRN